MSKERILIVDDEKVLCRSLKMDLEDEGYKVGIANSGEEAFEQISGFDPHVILLDLRLPGMDGIQVLKEIRDRDEDINVIIMTAYGDTQTTVEAIKKGAFNFINKPFELEELKALIKKALDSQTLKREVEFLRYQQRRSYRYCDLVGKSRQMREIYDQIDILAQTDITVLIRGESGTGKELVASAIHFKSKRNKAPFMEINCASLPESILESELFGYEKGALTDAKQLKKGLFELADRGTIFLDEIGEIPLTIQAKLLRFLEKKQFKRLGSGRDLKVDARIIAATNRDLEEAIKEDILLLANYFLDGFCRDMGKTFKRLSPEVTRIFENYPWRGNARELRNIIERAVIFCKGNIIDKDLLPPEMIEGLEKGMGRWIGGDAFSNELGLDDMLARVEEKTIKDALERTQGNKTRAAEILGISRFSLNRRIERLSRGKTSTLC